MYNNAVFIQINVGSHFGISDIVGSVLEQNLGVDSWINHREKLNRKFTCMACEDSETLGLSLHDLNKMNQEFSDAYD
jgi:hypothetical protein